MRFLKTNTAVRVTVGPFFDKTDGVTPETALTVTSCKLTLMVDTGDVPTLVLDTAPTASGGSNDMVHVTGDDAGFYDLELAAANVNYVGRAMLSITDAATHCPVFHEFMILPAKVYDSLVGGTDNLEVDTVQWLGTAAATPTTAGVPEVDVTHWLGTAAATPTVAGVPEVDTTHFAGTAATAASGIPEVKVASIAANAITAAATAADFGTEIAAAVWDALTSGMSTVGSIGKKLADWTVGTIDTYTGNTKQTGDAFARLGAPAGASVSADIAAVKTDTGNLVTRITANLFSGITKLAEWLGALAGKQAADATAQTEIRATGAGSGAYDPTTDSQEAIRDNMGTAQTGDSFARLGAPAGASIAADIAAIEAQTDDIGAAGAGLTAVPWNAAWDAEVQSEVQDAIEANHLDHLLAATYDPASKPGAADALLNELVESDAGVARYTANALEQAPSGGSATLVQMAGVVTRSGSTYYVSYWLIVNGALIAGASLSVLAVTFYDEDGDNLTFSGSPTAHSTGIVYANGTLTTPVTDNKPVAVKVTATYGGNAYSAVLPAVSIA